MQHDANFIISCLKTICPEGTPAEPAGIGSCGLGPCNLFCCNCDGGCKLPNIKNVNSSASVSSIKNDFSSHDILLFVTCC